MYLHIAHWKIPNLIFLYFNNYTNFNYFARLFSLVVYVQYMYVCICMYITDHAGPRP